MAGQIDPTQYVYVPLHRELYAEFVRRAGPQVNVARYIDDIVEGFLDRTKYDHPGWTDEYFANLATGQDDGEAQKKYGDPKRGYQWQTVFLPNGTQLRMTYKGTAHHAEVRNERIWYRDKEYSPAELARHIANNTSRNAWHDLWLLMPRETMWRIADDLRR
jgi:hypothetical protein